MTCNYKNNLKRMQLSLVSVITEVTTKDSSNVYL